MQLVLCPECIGRWLAIRVVAITMPVDKDGSGAAAQPQPAEVALSRSLLATTATR